MSVSDNLNTLKRPCGSCPWIVGNAAADIPHFELDLAEKLAATCPDHRGMGPGPEASLFACHQSVEGAEFACAGWLAVVGHRHPIVRAAVCFDQLDPEALRPRPGWPELHANYQQVLAKLRVTVPHKK